MSDWQRWQDELQRCHVLSLQVTAPVPPLRVVQTREAKYYEQRGRVLSLVGPERAVAFLREETLHALAGAPPLGPAARWYPLHVLEFGRPPEGSDFVEFPTSVAMVSLMNEGVRQLMREGIADQVAEYGREQRGSRPQCPWCHTTECDGCL